MTPIDVIVVGAGPTGLLLACELALAGARTRVLERRADQPNITRAFAVHARTLELLDARGLADQLVAKGIRVNGVQPVPGASLDLSNFYLYVNAPVYDQNTGLPSGWMASAAKSSGSGTPTLSVYVLCADAN